MKKENTHGLYYVAQTMLVICGIIAVQSVKGENILQVGILGVVTSFYILLAILHHFIHHTLTVKIVLEYILVGFLGISIFWFLLNGLV